VAFRRQGVPGDASGEPSGGAVRHARPYCVPMAASSAASAPPGPPDAGVVFPAGEDGTRSTSATGRAVVADAVRALAPALADEVFATGNWRSGYLRPFREMTRLALVRPGAATAISAAGLASVHERFRFRRGGEDLPLSAVGELAASSSGMSSSGTSLSSGTSSGTSSRSSPGTVLHTFTVAGTRPPGPDVLSVPYRGGRLVADHLDAQLDLWLDAGTAEPSFAAALRAVMAHPAWLDLRDVTVVVLGAGAQMGPVVSLLHWGAHVVAVDLPHRSGGPQIWTRMIEVARASSGRLSIPVRSPLAAGAGDEQVAAAAGVDLVARTPELLGWLAAFDGPFTLGNYVYAEGAAHVRAAVAVDALTSALLATRDDVSLAFLATPTDAFAVPPEVVADSRRRYEERSALRRVARLVSAGRLFRPNYPPEALTDGGVALGAVNDSLVRQQGPNYALAKRVQRWRALDARAAGRLVSLNVAPATRTRSVLRNRVLAAAYAGAHRFGVEVFDPSTSNTLMAALLVHDLRHEGAAARPGTALSHPLELFWQGANHGGLWRNPFEPRSVLGLAVALGMVQRGA
jgi:hypothetical protein